MIGCLRAGGGGAEGVQTKPPQPEEAVRAGRSAGGAVPRRHEADLALQGQAGQAGKLTSRSKVKQVADLML